MSLFITGTDTGVGKTHIAARLLHLLRASGIRCAGMKPICCGDRRDAEALLAAGSDCVAIDEVNPVWLKTPAAPIVGTVMEKVTIDIEQILLPFTLCKSAFNTSSWRQQAVGSCRFAQITSSAIWPRQ